MSGVPQELRDLVSRFDARGALARIQGARPPGGGRAAAVLILLSRQDGDYSIVFVEKNGVPFPSGIIR